MMTSDVFGEALGLRLVRPVVTSDSPGLIDLDVNGFFHTPLKVARFHSSILASSRLIVWPGQSDGRC